MRQYIWLASILLFVFPKLILAQDTIFQRNTERIHCSIIQIGENETRYSRPEFPKEIVFVIANNQLEKIVFGNGIVHVFSQKNSILPPNTKAKKNVIKITVFSILYDYSSIAFERSLRPGRSLEGTIGITGLGFDFKDNQRKGAFVKAGYKFIFPAKSSLYPHPKASLLNGFYIKPEVSFSQLSGYFHYWYPVLGDHGQWIADGWGEENRSVSAATLQLVTGYQVIIGIIPIDFYLGAGYGFTTLQDKKGISYTDSNNYQNGYYFSPHNNNFSFLIGMKIGLLY